MSKSLKYCFLSIITLYPSLNTLYVPESKGFSIHDGSTIPNSTSHSSVYHTLIEVHTP